MKDKAWATIALVLICTLLALPATVQAASPEPLTIEAQLWLTGQDSASGTFATSGLFVDHGAASEVFIVDTNAATIRGVKTLESAAGSIIIHFQAALTWTGPTTGIAEGRWLIVAGTGAYSRLQGAGRTHAELDLGAYPNPNIMAVYSGIARFN